MGLETWIMYGGAVDSVQAANGAGEPVNMMVANIIAGLAELGYVGTSTLTSGGTAAYMTITNKTSKLADLEKLIQFCKACNCSLVYTKGS